MTSWPNIPKGLRRNAPRTRPQGLRGVVGAKGPYPCKAPGCGLVYTPGYYKEHARDYHGAGRVTSWEA